MKNRDRSVARMYDRLISGDLDHDRDRDQPKRQRKRRIAEHQLRDGRSREEEQRAARSREHQAADQGGADDSVPVLQSVVFKVEAQRRMRHPAEKTDCRMNAVSVISSNLP